MGDQIFTSGMADRNLWTNRVYSVDLGAELVPDSVHQDVHGLGIRRFRRSRPPSPGRRADAINQAWLRFQIFF